MSVLITWRLMGMSAQHACFKVKATYCKVMVGYAIARRYYYYSLLSGTRVWVLRLWPVSAIDSCCPLHHSAPRAVAFRYDANQHPCFCRFTTRHFIPAPVFCLLFTALFIHRFVYLFNLCKTTHIVFLLFCAVFFQKYLRQWFTFWYRRFVKFTDIR